MKFATTVLFLFTIWGLYLWSVDAVSTKVLAQTEECFHETVQPGGSVSLAFVVTHGGQQDIDAYVLTTVVDDPSLDQGNFRSSYHRGMQMSNQLKTQKKEVKRWNKVSEGTYDEAVPSSSEKNALFPTKFTLCFSNKIARWTPKWVSFNFYVMAESGAESTDTESQLEKDDIQLEHAIHREGIIIHDVNKMMTKIRSEEHRHRDLVEATNAWVFYGTLVNGLLLIIMSFFQFWYLKKFLTVRHMIRV